MPTGKIKLTDWLRQNISEVSKEYQSELRRCKDRKSPYLHKESMKTELETKKRLFDTVIALFRSKGYQATTMREIAKEARTALGSAYYYYRAKEEIVLDYYLDTQMQVYEMSQKIIQHPNMSFPQKINEIFQLPFTILADSKIFIGPLAKEAFDPTSHISPFSEQSKEVRGIHVQLFRSLLNQFTNISADELNTIAYQLWLIQMALLFFGYMTNRRKQC